MKTKKYLFLMLAAALFAACSNDDEDGSTPPTDGTEQTPEEPSDSTQAVIDFADYANIIDMSYSTMIREYPDIMELFPGFYSYQPNDGKTESLFIGVNTSNSLVYTAIQTLTEDAFKEEDIVAYFTSKYKFYSKDSVDAWDEDYENVIGSTYTYTLGNADKQEEATLVITITGNESVMYNNPQNMPVAGETSGLGDMTPVEVTDNFLGENLEDILEEYPDMFIDMMGQYAAFTDGEDEGSYLEGIVLTLDEDEVVVGIRLLYAGGEEEVIEYYTENGYTCTVSGTEEDEEYGGTYNIYTITNGVVTINYSVMNSAGTATFAAED